MLALTLLNSSTQETIEPESVWVRVSSKKEIALSANFHPVAQQIAFSYIFPYSGEYEMEVKFKNNDFVIAEADFPMHIGKNNLKVLYASSLVLPLILAALIILLYIKLKRTKKKKN